MKLLVVFALCITAVNAYFTFSGLTGSPGLWWMSDDASKAGVIADSPLCNPRRGVADAAGNLYVLDCLDTVRLVPPRSSNMSFMLMQGAGNGFGERKDLAVRADGSMLYVLSTTQLVSLDLTHADAGTSTLYTAAAGQSFESLALSEKNNTLFVSVVSNTTFAYDVIALSLEAGSQPKTLLTDIDSGSSSAAIAVDDQDRLFMAGFYNIMVANLSTLQPQVWYEDGSVGVMIFNMEVEASGDMLVAALNGSQILTINGRQKHNAGSSLDASLSSGFNSPIGSPLIRRPSGILVLAPHRLDHWHTEGSLDAPNVFLVTSSFDNQTQLNSTFCQISRFNSLEKIYTLQGASSSGGLLVSTNELTPSSDMLYFDAQQAPSMTLPPSNSQPVMSKADQFYALLPSGEVMVDAATQLGIMDSVHASTTSRTLLSTKTAPTPTFAVSDKHDLVMFANDDNMLVQRSLSNASAAASFLAFGAPIVKLLLSPVDGDTLFVVLKNDSVLRGPPGAAAQDFSVCSTLPRGSVDESTPFALHSATGRPIVMLQTSAMLLCGAGGASQLLASFPPTSGQYVSLLEVDGTLIASTYDYSSALAYQQNLTTPAANASAASLIPYSGVHTPRAVYFDTQGEAYIVGASGRIIKPDMADVAGGVTHAYKLHYQPPADAEVVLMSQSGGIIYARRPQPDGHLAWVNVTAAGDVAFPAVQLGADWKLDIAVPRSAAVSRQAAMLYARAKHSNGTVVMAAVQLASGKVTLSEEMVNGWNATQPIALTGDKLFVLDTTQNSVNNGSLIHYSLPALTLSSSVIPLPSPFTVMATDIQKPGSTLYFYCYTQAAAFDVSTQSFYDFHTVPALALPSVATDAAAYNGHIYYLNSGGMRGNTDSLTWLVFGMLSLHGVPAQDSVLVSTCLDSSGGTCTTWMYDNSQQALSLLTTPSLLSTVQSVADGFYAYTITLLKLSLTGEASLIYPDSPLNPWVQLSSQPVVLPSTPPSVGFNYNYGMWVFLDAHGNTQYRRFPYYCALQVFLSVDSMLCYNDSPYLTMVNATSTPFGSYDVPDTRQVMSFDGFFKDDLTAFAATPDLSTKVISSSMSMVVKRGFWQPELYMALQAAMHVGGEMPVGPFSNAHALSMRSTVADASAWVKSSQCQQPTPPSPHHHPHHPHHPAGGNKTTLIVIGVVAGVVLLAAALFVWRRRTQSLASAREPLMVQASDSSV
eukprot:PLAT6342.1.p1 GENE.PLAT6342.1~~PLAT6342.1.p1  ORF type:complete len:1209 (-),score=535.83 PLAT6342.1:63-3689(-)